MKKTLFLLCLTFVLAGCTANTTGLPTDAYADDEVYQGYPCKSYCDSFQLGFDAAESNNYTHIDQCQFADPQENIGCKAYVQEYYFENKTFDQLIKSL